jgi:lipopolysaccharide transport system ATP-binding protein
MTAPAITAEHLSKRYRLGEMHTDLLSERLGNLLRRKSPAAEDPRDFWALRGLDFEVQEGDVVGIIGRNGAGKSTLLKILSRLTSPTEGRARIRGRLASLLEVGTGFHPELTGRENIFLNATILGMRRREIQRKFDAIVAFSGVEAFIDTPVKRYSSGMYVRLAFAVAAHVETDILIVDEVLAVGDAEFQKRCLGKMGEVARSGRTVLFVSHNLVAVRTLCNRGIVLDKGQLVLKGTAEECVSAYENYHTDARGAVWTASDLGDKALAFTRVRCELAGRQPEMKLELEVEMQSVSDHKPAFLAVDIVDAGGTPVMQALPQLHGFVLPDQREHSLRLTIDLPPMIPGFYYGTLWAGSHNTETLDWVAEAISFEITDSPTPGRTFPHTKDHGFIVPPSTVREL